MKFLEEWEVSHLDTQIGQPFVIQGAVLMGSHALADPQRYSRQYIYLLKKNIDFKKAVHDFTKHSHQRFSLLYKDRLAWDWNANCKC